MKRTDHLKLLKRNIQGYNKYLKNDFLDSLTPVQLLRWSHPIDRKDYALLLLHDRMIEEFRRQQNSQKIKNNIMEKEDLMDLKIQIDQAKEKVSELKGKRQYLLSELKEQWGCSTIEEAKEKIEMLVVKIEKLEQTIQSGMKKLDEYYV
jgi:hypothetical protein